MEVGRQYELISIEDGANQDDNGATHMDRAGGEDPALDGLLMRQETAEYLDRLPTRERVILVMRFYLDMSQEAVGSRLGISQMHVSRLQHRALQRLRKLMKKS